jgi:plastocyanin
MRFSRTALFQVIALTLGAAGAAQAEEKLVIQKNKSFSVSQVKLKVGDTLAFRNDDPFFHNIFSLSDAQSFDLGSYPQGQTRKVALNKEGKLEVECAMHPEMKLMVEVVR